MQFHKRTLDVFKPTIGINDCSHIIVFCNDFVEAITGYHIGGGSILYNLNGGVPSIPIRCIIEYCWIAKPNS